MTAERAATRRRGRRAAGLLWVVVLALGMLSAASASAQRGEGAVLATTIDDPITPVIADHLADGIERAGDDGYLAYLIRLDTPGGLDSSMRSIVQDILASDVPVIVHISPRGARGASAGAVVAFAAHVAAMAPGTAIGAATPVSIDGGEDLEDKIVNDATAYVTALAELRGRSVEFARDTVEDGRSASAREALELGAIDVVAESDDDLLRAIDGSEVALADDRTIVLHVEDAGIEEHDLGLLRGIQQTLADPNLAYLLLSIGTLGLVYELASPGVGVGGALGLLFVLLALVGLAVLPVDVVGLLFLGLAAACFVAEVYAPGIGIAAAGGALFLVLSGVFLFDDTPGLELSLAVVLPAAAVVSGFVVVAGRLALRTRTTPATTTGMGALLGQHAAVSAHGGGPQVFLHGAWWSVHGRDPDLELSDGTEVEVVATEGLRLVVEPRSPAPSGDPDEGAAG
jgi:membrane-bound serine protease (ClpP class)